MTFETITTGNVAPHVLLVELNRPTVSNSINTQMGEELLALWDGLVTEPARYRAIVLTGAGERAFCAGGDLKQRDGMTDAQWQAQHLVFERMTRAFLAVTAPIVGAVNGAAYGGGCELALCCDFVYAADDARFALTEVTLGIMPGLGGTQLLPRAVGERRAKELILTGRPFSAREALDWGLVNAVMSKAELRSRAVETATRIAANAPFAVRQAKHAIHHGLQMDLRSALMFEIEAYNRLPGTEDRREGVAAFNEKRAAVFTGR